MTMDLASRIAALAAQIEARLTEDWRKADSLAYACRNPDKQPDFTFCGGPAAEAYWQHFHPYRQLEQVKATRVLVDAILAEPHDYNPCDEYYSCSQAVDPDPAPGEGGPGSGCSDPDRAGDPCDCGRDQRAERLLRIIASQWEDSQ